MRTLGDYCPERDEHGCPLPVKTCFPGPGPKPGCTDRCPDRLAFVNYLLSYLQLFCLFDKKEELFDLTEQLENRPLHWAKISLACNTRYTLMNTGNSSLSPGLSGTLFYLFRAIGKKCGKIYGMTKLNFFFNCFSGAYMPVSPNMFPCARHGTARVLYSRELVKCFLNRWRQYCQGTKKAPESLWNMVVVQAYLAKKVSGVRYAAQRCSKPARAPSYTALW